MKLEMPTKVSAVFLMAALLAAGLIAAGGSASAQTDDTGSPADAVAAEAVSDTGGAGVAAVPMDLPLSESDLVGSVMYRRSGEFERFDTDHDIDPPSGISGASGASGASDTSEDREVVGSHYLLGDIFNVRVPASYAGKPGRVFAFSFNHIVLQSGDGHFTADCDNQRVFAYKDSGAARWRCDLDFGNSASGWAEATASAAQVSIAAAWSDEGCSNGEYGIETGNKEPLLVADCEALLAVKHHWLDEHPENRHSLKSKHTLRSWGSGDIEGWEGVEVGEFHMTEAQFKDNCDKDVKPECPRRVLGVRLPVRDGGRIVGGIPVELGGVGNAGSGDCAMVGPVSDSGFAGVGCGLGALRILDLRGNALSGGIPWQLGNVSAAPCGKDVATPELDLISSITVVLFVLGLLAVPFTAGASVGVTLGSLGLTAGAVGLFVDVDISLGEYLFGCRVPSGALSRRAGSVESGGGGGGEVSFDRARFPRGYSGVELAGRQRGEDGRAMFSGVLLGVGGAGVALAGVDSDELIEIKVSGKVRKVRAGLIQGAARAAGYVGALSDVIDIVSGLFKTAELEFLHLDRSQLQFLDLSGNNDLPGNNPGNKLSGPVPVEIGNLDSLEYLDLSDNELTGAIPGNAGRGARPVHDRLVYFDASNNDFVGGVPPLLSTRLRVVDFSGNELGGSVPPSWVLLFGLEHLDLSSTGLSGELPTFIAGMNYLGVLYLNDNNLSGTVPSRIGEIYDTDNLLCQFLRDRWPWRWGESLNWLSPLSWLLDQLDACTGSEKIATDQLWDIDISGNLFHGEIPDNLGNLPILDSLDLRHNCFVGDVPGKLLDKSTSEDLSLEYGYNLLDNQLASNTMLTSAACAPCFDGTYLPANAKKDLKEDCATLLGLKNHWGASFPYRWGEAGQKEMSSWRGVSLSGNRVAGLELSGLGLSGTVPDSLAGLDSLTSLRLDRNRLTGGIPLALSELDDLETLDLSNNMLSGEIPDSLGDIAHLTDLDLSHNMLSGEIPVGGALKFSSIVRLDLSYNKLSGNLPQPLPANTPPWIPSSGDSAGLSNLLMVRYLDLSHNFFTGPLIESVDRVGFLKLEGSVLKLNDNCLTGTISWAIKELLGPEEDISNNDLDYWIIPTSTELLDQPEIDISNNDLDYTGWRGAGGTARKRCISVGCSTGELVENPSSNAGLVSDCEVLLELSEHWSSSAAVESWGTDSAENINSWKGVTITDKRVTKLELPGKELSGNIPERIGRLSHLQTLDLSSNTLTEEIPESLRYLASLQTLNLSDNSLSGPIPEELSDLESLRTLDLHKNQLTDSIPASLGRLAYLESLKLQHNKLTGAIPEQLADISSLPKIETMNLSMNCLLGPVPTGLARVTIAWGNLFGTANDNPNCDDPCSDGTFVSSVPQIVRGVVASPLVDDCRALWAARKHWNTAAPTAKTSPQQWGTSSHQDITDWPGVTVRQNRVKEIDLSVSARTPRSPQLRGTVPAVLGDLSTLEILNLSGNRLSGEIPVGLHRLGRLMTLNLSRNLLSGPVPESFGLLASLLSLDLSHNRLTGQLPSVATRTSASSIPTFVRPQNLEGLYLNDNEFEGIILPQITSHANLKNLHLSNNDLHGPIPPSIVTLRLLSDLRLNHNKLTGPAPIRLERMIKLRYLYLQNNCLTGQDPGPALRIAFAYYITLSGGPTSLPAIRTQNNLFDNTVSENKSCGQTCRDSVPNPDTNTLLVRDCIALLEIRDKWAAQTMLPEGSAMTTWGSSQDSGEQNGIDRWQGVTIEDNRVTGLDLSGHALTSPAPTELANLSELTRLNLSNNDFTSFPSPVLEFRKLATLNLTNNKIPALPANINKLTNLTYLNLANNRIVALPASMGKLESLTSLDLSWNSIASLSFSDGDFSSLVSLDLHRNDIVMFSPSSGSLPKLASLNLAENDLTRIPDGIGHLTNLQILDLSRNFRYERFSGGARLSGAIPASFSNLVKLQSLSLAGNGYGSGYDSSGEGIPSGIGNIRSLVKLDMSGNRIEGYIPSFLGNLTSLKWLDLSGNRFTGSIPVGTTPVPGATPTLNRLIGLVHLDLEGNDFSGGIPSEISRLKNLEYLYLSLGEFSGSIPEEIGMLTKLKEFFLSGEFKHDLYLSLPESFVKLKNLQRLRFYNIRWAENLPSIIGKIGSTKLTHLDISHNILSGSIPAQIGNLQKLTHLDFNFNELSGSIPAQIGQLRKLTHLDLSRNRLVGSIPAQIGNLQNLTHLDLSENLLSGEIPSQIGSLSKLEHLDISSKSILHIHKLFDFPRRLTLPSRSTHPGISGAIPTSMGNLRNLKYLDLSSNSLSGQIPSSFRHLVDLNYLNLSFNRRTSQNAMSLGITGQIPIWIDNLYNLISLHLAGNSLSGEIPTDLSELPRLTALDLGGNMLTGEIPIELGSKNSIYELYLENNMLSGSIPPSLGNSNLSKIYLSNNRLTGRIPPQLANLRRIYTLDLSNNRLTGQIPSQFANFRIRILDLSDNRLTGTIPPLSRDLRYLNLVNNDLSGRLPDALCWLLYASSNYRDYGTDYFLSIDNNVDARHCWTVYVGRGYF